MSLRQGERAATIHHLLARSSSFVRKAAFANEPQVVAANVDVVLIVTSLAAALNLRRLERTLAIAWEGGATPAVILTKADLCSDVGAQLAAIGPIAAGIRVLPVSAVTGLGMTELRGMIPKGTTAVVLGLSGAGKSTLVNILCGQELMATQGVRANDGRGRHTTTHRELVLLPQGGCILDTPGMRELGLWEAESGLAAVFDDIDALASQCRFTNCSHATEPGCAIRAALATGSLDQARWQSYGKLQHELMHRQRKDKQIAAVLQRKRLKVVRAGPRDADIDEE